MDPFLNTESLTKMNLLQYCAANARDYTYIGIGSKNRTADIYNFTPDMDQILPCFLDNVKDKTIRVIHFDPLFAPEYDNGFLKRYFIESPGNHFREGSCEVVPRTNDRLDANHTRT
jgi:hypothetical protein